MPRTFLQSVIFTMIMAPIMVYIMSVYNGALVNGGLETKVFYSVGHNFWFELAIAFPWALFFAGRIAPKLAFQIIGPEAGNLVKIPLITLFIVCIMVISMSFAVNLRLYGLIPSLYPHFLRSVCFNFILALPMQLVIVGPVVRFLFHSLLRLTEVYLPQTRSTFK